MKVKMEEKSLRETLREYQVVFMPSRNWAAKTRVNYRNDIADLLRFLEGRSKTDPNRVDLQDLEAYMAELDRRGYTGTTRRRKTSSIKSLFGFLERYVDAKAVTDAPPGRAHWEEGVDFARAQQHAEHHQRLFEERVTRAEALARGLGLQRLTVGPIEWWFDDEGNFRWRRSETPQVDGWEQGRLPGCDIDNEEVSK